MYLMLCDLGSLPPSTSMDYQTIDKDYLQNHKQHTTSHLQQNFKLGQETHWTFHNRAENVYQPKNKVCFIISNTPFYQTEINFRYWSLCYFFPLH